jgi:hypothetical protein
MQSEMRPERELHQTHLGRILQQQLHAVLVGAERLFPELR